MPWEKQFDMDEVLDRAMQAFWARGYQATSLQDLVKCTGINRGSLYSTYTDKRALFIAALRRYDSKYRRELLARLETEYEPREAIHQLFLAFTSQISEEGGNRGCFLTNTALELAAHDPEVGRLVATSQQEIEAFFARMIKQGKAQGQIPANVKSAETARGLLASLIGLIVLTRSRPDRALLDSIVVDAMRRLV
jgi:TetR/AcrR family transcriptional repressor of nem operon